MRQLQPPAMIFLVAGASCAGKDSVLSKLLAARPEIGKVVTTTTREPRAGETPGVAYHFIPREEFATRKERGDFIESADVHGQFYGTSRQAVEAVFAAGKLPVGIMDVQGIAQVQDRYSCATAFIMCEIETLARRMATNRPASQVTKRLASVPAEIEAGLTYDKVIYNEDGEDNLRQASEELVEYYDTVVRARLTRYREAQITQKRRGPAI